MYFSLSMYIYIYIYVGAASGARFLVGNCPNGMSELAFALEHRSSRPGLLVRLLRARTCFRENLPDHQRVLPESRSRSELCANYIIRMT